MKPPKISKNKKIFILLLIIDLFLVVFHLISQKYFPHLEIANRFNLEEEASLPTWFSQTQLFLAAAVTFYLARIHQTKPWYLLSFIMLYLSIDEGSEIHELGSTYARQILNIEQGYFFFAWVIPAAVIVFGVILLYLKFWWKLPSQTRWLIFASALIFITGAMGFEIISSHYWSEVNNWQFNFTYRVLNAFEEGFEMLGISLFIYSLLDYFKIKNKVDI